MSNKHGMESKIKLNALEDVASPSEIAQNTSVIRERVVDSEGAWVRESSILRGGTPDFPLSDKDDMYISRDAAVDLVISIPAKYKFWRLSELTEILTLGLFGKETVRVAEYRVMVAGRVETGEFYLPIVCKYLYDTYSEYKEVESILKPWLYKAGLTMKQLKNPDFLKQFDDFVQWEKDEIRYAWEADADLMNAYFENRDKYSPIENDHRYIARRDVVFLIEKIESKLHRRLFILAESIEHGVLGPETLAIDNSRTTDVYVGSFYLPYVCRYLYNVYSDCKNFRSFMKPLLKRAGITMRQLQNPNFLKEKRENEKTE